MALGDDIEQWQFEFDEFLMGDDTTIDVVEVTGLDSMDTRSGDAVISGAHGSLPGQDRLESRVVTFELVVYEEEEVAMYATLHEMARAFGPRDTEAPLTFRIGDQPAMRINARGRRRTVDIKTTHLQKYAEVTLQVAASDPLVYSEALSSSSADAPDAPQGRAFSAAFPYNFGVPGSGGVVNVFNAGTAPAPWVARINGPCVNPTIIGPGGEQLTWESSLALGEFLEFDAHPSRETVMVGGTSTQFGSLSDTSTWFQLPVGTSNVVLNTGDGNGSVLLSWRSAWWSAT